MDHGDIRFDGHSILSQTPHQVSRAGLCRTFQNLALFEGMSVMDNVLVGGHQQFSSGLLAQIFGLGLAKRQEAGLRKRASELLFQLGLESIQNQVVTDLPFGTRKRIEIARALMAKPKLILLDEPAGGLNHEELDELADLIRDLRDRHDMTVLLVEHHMGLVMSLSDRVVALNFGRKIAEGTPDEIRNHEEVIEAYLGAST